MFDHPRRLVLVFPRILVMVHPRNLLPLILEECSCSSKEKGSYCKKENCSKFSKKNYTKSIHRCCWFKYKYYYRRRTCSFCKDSVGRSYIYYTKKNYQVKNIFGAHQGILSLDLKVFFFFFVYDVLWLSRVVILCM